jgi:hypothetical protein
LAFSSALKKVAFHLYITGVLFFSAWNFSWVAEKSFLVEVQLFSAAKLCNAVG